MLWIVFALLSAFTAALVALFGKLGLKDIDPTIATTVRSLIMAGFLVAVSVLYKRSEIGSISHFNSRDWTFIALAGVAGALSWLFYFLALKAGPASRVATIDRLSIIFVIVLAALFLGEALTWKAGVGALFIALGAILIVLA